MAELTSDHMLGEAMLFDPVMQQSYLVKEFNADFKPVSAINPGSPIEFSVPKSEKNYLDLNNSWMVVTVQVVKPDGTAFGHANAIKTSTANLLLHTLFKDVSVQLSTKSLPGSNNMYPYRAYLETLINYSDDVKKTRLITEGWYQDTHGASIEEAEPANNTGLVSRETNYVAASPMVQLVGRPHVDIFQQDKLIPPSVDLRLKLIPADDKFVIISADAGGGKIKIVDATLYIHVKQLTEAAELAHRELVLQQNYRYPYSSVQMKHMAVNAGLQTVRFEGIFGGALPDLVVVGLVGDTEFTGSIGTNPFAFRNHGVVRMSLTRDTVQIPRQGYTPNFTTGQYIKDYMTFQEQLGFDQGDKAVQLTPAQWADGFTLYSFKVTDGPIGSGTYGPRSHAYSGSLNLEIEFKDATAKALKLIVMYQKFSILEIDQFGGVVDT